MSNRPLPILSRRAVLAGCAAAAVSSSGGFAQADGAQAAVKAGPVFSPSGPDAERYGAAENYPIKDPGLSHQPGNPLSPKYRVGAFSHFDEIFPVHRIARATTPWQFKRTPAELRYTYKGQPSSVADYLSRNPVTGLLIARDDEILFEHYQYGRTDRDRLMSQSMAKTITGLLIGIATGDGAIRSVDDTAETYVAGLNGTEYGNTPLRALLHMSSGVDFGEERDNGRDLDRLWIDMVRGGRFFNKGTVGSMAQFNRRIAPPGTRFYYASVEADVLGAVLRAAVDTSMSDYLHDKVWAPIGMEADATWMVDAQGHEVAHGFFNAVLRDYARLGRLLAHDGAWGNRQIVPAQWMIDATTVRTSDGYLAPGKATHDFGYGYLMWLLPWGQRQFALFGALGQRICVDPVSKLVMVHTAVEQTAEIWTLWNAAVAQLGQR
ncbi:MAG: serine hydrolase [Proteobacteria bacterium]|nr:serine hydrolase [Pseudomonadota bacterium]